ncbi:hypothetical protein KDL01_17215 [Actinospica durhamensis]|uniref:Uncharacterized protein n=1 Tax=Actinospica durhamensis TaxID=1508375 RepID=A0A941ISL7_9ACTN|nr:hypothetical protein [Actinospica durhamensis]MBR7835018.1 hypothetical protein [Actinospica durhamensis]
MNQNLGISVDFQAFAALACEGAEVWMEFTPDRPVEAAFFDAMGSALAAANEATGPDGFGASVIPTVAGGVTILKYPPSEQALRDWLDLYTARLWAEGWGGSLHLAPAVRRPDWQRDLHAPILTVFASYGETPAAALCEAAVGWARRHGGPDEYLLSGGLTLADTTGELGRHLHRALEQRRMIGACRASAQPGPLARISLTAHGHASYQLYDPEFAPIELAQQARETLTIGCEYTRWAAATLTDRQSNGWAILRRTLGQKIPAPGWTIAHNNPAWSTYVPDAFGMQLLNDEHLSRFADTSKWAVTEVAARSYLVEAPDLAAWLRPQGPPPEILAAARADFGPAIAPADLPRNADS